MRAGPKRILYTFATAALLGTALVSGTAQAQEPSSNAAGVFSGFSPSSTSWTSATKGWVLGWTPCDTGQCVTLRRTTDGGRTWVKATAPDITPSTVHERTRVFFAERGGASIGLATNGQDLYASSDGARTWQRETLAGVTNIGGIDANDTDVFVVGHTATSESTVDTQAFSTPIRSRHWKPVKDVHISGAGYLGNTISTVATAGRAVQVSTASFGGVVQLWTGRNGHNFRTANPCDEWSDLQAGWGEKHRQFVLCSFDKRQGHMFKNLQVSADGGTFTSVSMAPELGLTTDFAVADDDTLAIGAEGGDMGFVHMSFDGGLTWQTTLAVPDTGPVFDLDFQDPLHGTLVVGHADLGTTVVYHTVDGGRTWQPFKL